MNKLIKLKDCSLNKNKSFQESQKNSLDENKIEKILCDHCGRSASNGIRCLGICVADSDY